MNELITHDSWMRDVPEDTPVTALSIPGTHNSCCVSGPLGLAQTQHLDLTAQLAAGIRFLDIRLAHYQDELCVHHDVHCTENSYPDVLDACSAFLDRHPSEAILMSVDHEKRLDSALGRFAPSRVLCAFLKGGGEECDENTRSFAETFQAKTWEHIGDAPLFYNFTAVPPGNSRPAVPAFTARTTLGDIRGKIVLLRRFEGSKDMGLDLTYWPENQRFRSAAPPFYDVEDRYQNPGEDDKFNFVVTHLEDAIKDDPEDLYITFSSAVDLTAHGYSKTTNPRLNDYLAKSVKGRIGIVVMDFFEEPRELVSNVLRMNPAG